MNEHLPVLQVLLPLFAAVFCVFIRHRTACRVLAILCAWGCLAIAWQLLGVVQADGVISYHVGGWAPPLGIELRIDILNAYVLVIVSMIAAIVFPFGFGYWTDHYREGQEYLFFSVLLLCLCGLLGICVTGDAFNVFVFLEITSLSSYALIAMGRNRRALRAAFTYLAMGTIGGTFILLGIGMLYLATGTLNMADIAERLPAVVDSRTVLVAFAILTAGIFMKLAVFPLHQWLPSAYAYSPGYVSAFLAATATKVQFYLLVRVIFTLFGASYVFGVLRLEILLLPLSIMAMFFGSAAAIFQTDLKKLLAYSSVAQIGYMTLGLSFNNVDGLTGGLLHLFNHSMMKGGLFLVITCMAFCVNSTNLQDIRGLGRKMPFTVSAFILGGLSLIGLPGTVGFVSKFYLVTGALERGWLVVAVLILLSSLLAVVYIWRVVEVLFFKEPVDPAKEVCEAPLTMLIPAWLLVIGGLVFGLNATWSAGVAKAAAIWLLGGVA